jgi:hypothetical protein
MKFTKSLMTFLMLLALSGIAFGQTYTAEHRGGSSIPTADAIDFSGSGQDDINVTGVYEGTMDRCYEVQATATSTYKWRASCNFGSYTTGVTMSTTATEIENGIKVDWDTASGHTSTDSWKFNVSAVNPWRVKNSQGENAIVVDNDEDIRFFSGQITSTNAFKGLEVQDAVGVNHVSMNREFVSVNKTIALTADMSGGWFMTDTVGNAKIYTLPKAAVGLRFGFIVQSAGLLTITENGGDTITCGSASTGTTVTSSTADDVIELLGTSSTDWVCVTVLPTQGDWTYN